MTHSTAIMTLEPTHRIMKVCTFLNEMCQKSIIYMYLFFISLSFIYYNRLHVNFQIKTNTSNKHIISFLLIS